MKWAAQHAVPVRFCDLPAAVVLAQRDQRDARDASASDVRTDPVAALAEAAGYDDPERWWEDAIEHRRDSTLDRFAMLSEAMATVRECAGSRSNPVEKFGGGVVCAVHYRRYDAKAWTRIQTACKMNGSAAELSELLFWQFPV